MLIRRSVTRLCRRVRPPKTLRCSYTTCGLLLCFALFVGYVFWFCTSEIEGAALKLLPPCIPNLRFGICEEGGRKARLAHSFVFFPYFVRVMVCCFSAKTVHFRPCQQLWIYNSLDRIYKRSFFSFLDTCTCVMPSTAAADDCVIP